MVGACILVVEDETTNQLLLKSTLEKQGYVVDLAGDGEQAISALSGKPYDLVMLDLHLPGRTGLEVLQWMKTRDMLRRTPVIVVSASEELDAVVNCIEEGATDYVPKPFDRVLLTARVRSALATKRLDDLLEQREITETNPSIRAARAQLSPATRAAAATLSMETAAPGPPDDDSDLHEEPTITSDRTAIAPSPHEERSLRETLAPASIAGRHDGRWERIVLLPGIELHVREANALSGAPEWRQKGIEEVLDRMRERLGMLE